MPTGAPGVVGGDASTGRIDQNTSNYYNAFTQGEANRRQSYACPGAGAAPSQARPGASQQQQGMTGQGAQFIYVAATVANILCENLSQTQINLLANFLSVVTTCVYAILTVENPTEVLES